MRLYNERLVLSLIRSHGQLPKAEIARLTGLSPQTVSVIVRQLQADDLVRKGTSVRGKVGQPLQPFSLNPDGALSIGLKIGRRSGDMILLGLDGKVRKSVRRPYHFPSPGEFVTFAKSGLEELLAGLDSSLHERICGVGIASPFDLWKWEEETGAPHEVMEAWKDFNITSEMMRISPWPVIPCNDATAACAAELFFGLGQTYRDFAYIYIGYFAGGGVVLDGHLRQGPTGNAGAIGSIPVPREGGGSEQLIRSASLYLLENDVRARQVDLWLLGDDWSDIAADTERWAARAARSLAIATASLAATLDCTAVIIDGAMPALVRAMLVDKVNREIRHINLDGISRYEVVAGSIGFDARALGAASLPLFANYMIDPTVLFRDAA